jgi:urease accessory protein
MAGPGATDESLRLLRLFQLFDSQLPVGAFAHSGGLETYGQAGAGLAELRELMANQVTLGWGRSELATACLAWDAAAGADSNPRLERIGLVAGAGKVIPAVRETSLRLGRRTLALLRRLHPQIFGSLTLSTPHHAVIVGAAGRMLDLPRTDVLLGYGHSLLAGALAAATRCMPISPMQAQELVVELHPALVRAVDDAMRDPEAGLFTCTPALDVRSHQQGLLTTRLFQS